MTEEQLNQIIIDELEKTQKHGQFRVFQTALELEAVKKLAEKKDSSPISEALLILYGELKHSLLSLTDEHSEVIRLLEQNGIDFESKVMERR